MEICANEKFLDVLIVHTDAYVSLAGQFKCPYKCVSLEHGEISQSSGILLRC